MKSRLSVPFIFRWLAVLFGLFLVGVIFLAGRGIVQEYFGFLYAFPFGDQIGHFVLMGILSLLLALGFSPQRVRLGRLGLLRTSLILAVLVTMEETSQLFLQNRTFSLLDLSANYAGIFLFGEAGAWIKEVWQ